MTIRPLFLLRNDHTEGSPASGPASPRYRRYGDDQLMAERERRQRQMEELTFHADGDPATHAQLVSIDEEVTRISDELVRRARSRHPSSFHPAS